MPGVQAPHAMALLIYTISEWSFEACVPPKISGINHGIRATNGVKTQPSARRVGGRRQGRRPGHHDYPAGLSALDRRGKVMYSHDVYTGGLLW